MSEPLEHAVDKASAEMVTAKQRYSFPTRIIVGGKVITVAGFEWSRALIDLLEADQNRPSPFKFDSAGELIPAESTGEIIRVRNR